jgi:hypothetical protein
MASNYKEAYKATCKFEGGYANDKNDTGGETYKGIARNYWPKWAGWKTVDASKVNGVLSSDSEAKLQAQQQQHQQNLVQQHQQNQMNMVTTQANHQMQMQHQQEANKQKLTVSKEKPTNAKSVKK